MFAIVSMICGAVAAFLMNRERMRVNDEAGVIAVQLTGWFWLAFILTLVEIGTAIGGAFETTARAVRVIDVLRISDLGSWISDLRSDI